MNKHIIQLLLIVILLTACGPAVLPSPPTATATATQTITPSRTPRPMQTSTITSIPQIEGPHLLLAYHSDLTIMDINGNIQKQIQLPDYAYTAELENAISPDGNLLAYFTGSTNEPYDLALNLLNLSNGTSQTIANLIAPGFPQNLRPVAETLRLSDYDPNGCNNVECLAIVSSSDFILGISSYAWSPDGQYLAFAAQIDGPSSDIYIYDRKNHEIRRLTDEIENIWEMKWSPSGEKILYRATVPGPIDSYVYWYTTDPKVNPPQETFVNIAYPYSEKLGWITKDSFLYAPWPEGFQQLLDNPKYGSVRYINLENNEIKEIWPHEAESIAFDLTSGKVILSAKGIKNPEITGTYLVSPDGSYIKISDTIYKFFEDQEPFNAFFGLDSNGQMYSISTDGDIKLLGPSMEYATPSISPNKKWFLIFENNNKIALYSDDFRLQKSWNFDEYFNSSSIKWRADSLGLLISVNEKKYYLSIPAGEPQLKPQLLNVYEPNYVWLP